MSLVCGIVMSCCSVVLWYHAVLWHTCHPVRWHCQTECVSLSDPKGQWAMFKLIFCLVCASVTVSPSSSCLQCFVDPNDAVRMCWGYIIIEHDVRNIGECMRMVDRIFNHNKTVMDAGRVGESCVKMRNRSYLLVPLLWLHSAETLDFHNWIWNTTLQCHYECTSLQVISKTEL